MSAQIETITLDQYRAAVKAQGVPLEDVVMTCPICGTVQSARDLIRAGAGDDFAAVEKYLGFSCVGRFTNAGPFGRKSEPGLGCDWTLGGLFQLHKLEVITPDGERHARFKLASPEEAQSHAREGQA